jgi:hypothetical protein
VDCGKCRVDSFVKEDLVEFSVGLESAICIQEVRKWQISRSTDVPRTDPGSRLGHLSVEASGGAGVQNLPLTNTLRHIEGRLMHCADIGDCLFGISHVEMIVRIDIV